MPVSPVSLPAPTILVFDSGVGGLSVFREIAKAQPQAHFIYAADDAAFPYGALSDETLIARIGQVMDGLIAQYQPSLVVIACNTASTLALPGLRARHALPFVGTVPAVKPACAASVSRRISILATPATVRRDYTSSLIREFASACSVNLVPSSRLAGLVEEVLAGREVADADILAEIAPCFVDEGGSVPMLWCWPARIIRCWWSGCRRLHPGRLPGWIPLRPSPAASRPCLPAGRSAHPCIRTWPGS